MEEDPDGRRDQPTLDQRRAEARYRKASGSRGAFRGDADDGAGDRLPRGFRDLKHVPARGSRREDDGA
ncbi:MAG: hypothetical protein AAFQ37_14850 [Bacteroidota bacterium]